MGPPWHLQSCSAHHRPSTPGVHAWDGSLARAPCGRPRSHADSHYWRPWPKALVPAITVLQIAQLAVVTYAWTVSPGECPAERWAKAPEEHVLAYLTPYAMVPVFLWLFVVFFVKRFILQKPKGDKAKR